MGSGVRQTGAGDVLHRCIVGCRLFFKLPEDFALPGGIGLISNYRHCPQVLSCLDHFLRRGKPIGAMCAGIDFLRMTIGRDLLLEEAAQLSPRGFCRDAAKNIYYTPAFRKSQSCYDVLLGIDGMVSAMASLRP